uniref:Haem-binding uptake Tiki superfamily ChaN domain-containing protein n=1 Tax=Phaeomonas parva TaxID=124430 RepID=A0A6U4EE27_9STRA
MAVRTGLAALVALACVQVQLPVEAWRGPARAAYAARLTTMREGAGSRRDAVGRGLGAAGTGAAALGLPGLAQALPFFGGGSTAPSRAPGTPPPPAKRPALLRVVVGTPPVLQPYSNQAEKRVVKEGSEMDALIFGMHTSSSSSQDAELAVKHMTQGALSGDKELGFALATFDRRQQAALDAYAGDKSSSDRDAEAALVAAATAAGADEIAVRNQLPLLRFARERGATLLAVGVPPAVLQGVDKGGLEGMSAEDRQYYVPDADAFLSTIRVKGFQRYAQNVILGADAPQGKNAFAVAILRHEAMASGAARYLRKGITEGVRRQAILVADTRDVIYYFGAQMRLQRLAPQPETRAEGAAPAEFKVRSILLNPTASDSLSELPELRLALGITPKSVKEAYPLADLICFSGSPAVSLLTRMSPIET